MGNVLDKFHYGIYVMGTVNGDMINTMIASWVTQLSGDPALVGVAVKKGRRTAEMLEQGEMFTLALLGKDHAAAMSKFKGEKIMGPGTINDEPVKIASNGAPVPEQCVGYVELRMQAQADMGNHILFIGQVLDETMVDGGEALAVADLDGHVYRGT